MTDCIVFILPSYKTEIARALRAAFGKPVLFVVLWQHVENKLNLTKEEMQEIGCFVSVPEFYFEHIGSVRQMSYDALDRLQIDLEKRLGIRENGMMVAYDRDLRTISDYRTSRELQVIYLMFAEKLFQEYAPSFIISGRECYLRNIISDVGLRLGIPACCFSLTRSTGHRIAAFDAKGQQMGLREAFADLQRGETAAFDAADLEQADQRYDAFVERPVQPKYATIYMPSLQRSLAIALTKGMGSVIKNACMYYGNEFDRTAGELTSPLKVLSRWPVKSLRMGILDYCGFAERNPDLTRKFIYLPLHFTPEETDMYFGREYSHHEGFVISLSKRIPSDCCLYVKDHTGMIGQRPLSFYQRLKEVYNVELVHHRTNTFDLINNAQAVLTVTGTAGWEGYLLNKPVVVLGDVFYNFLPGVLHANLYAPDFTEKLVHYLRTFRPDPAERRAALRACCASSLDVGVEIGTGDMVNENVHAESVARIIKTLADRWGQTLVRQARERGIGSLRGFAAGGHTHGDAGSEA